jgi:TetR/AcrR family transcriptional regulator, lmrAB and yxaGH operons repressor
MARLVAERDDVIPILGEIFRRYGFEGASIARITEQTKLGKGSLYHFFPGGKEEMAEAVLGSIRGWFEDEVFLPLERERPEIGITRMFERVEAYFCSGRRICLLGAFALEETRDRFAVAVRGYFERWISVLSDALCRNGMKEASAEELANDIVAGIQGAIVLSRALDDERRFSIVLKNLALKCNIH